jgi:hypothetical protein
MKKSVVLLLSLVFVLPSALYADQATIEEVVGKVEIRPIGGDWSLARQGTVVNGGDTISTGFGSSASIKLGGSTVTVTPLTRLTLEELVEREGAQQTRLFLQVGKVRADVRTAEGLSHDFQLRSASTTASVRGTSFEFDGVSVRGFTGEVQVSNLAGHGRRVIRGERVTAEGVAPPVPGEQERERSSRVRRVPQGTIEEDSPGSDDVSNVPSRIEPTEVVEVLQETLDMTDGSLSITVRWPE